MSERAPFVVLGELFHRYLTDPKSYWSVGPGNELSIDDYMVLTDEERQIIEAIDRERPAESRS